MTERTPQNIANILARLSDLEPLQNEAERTIATMARTELYYADNHTSGDRTLLENQPTTYYLALALADAYTYAIEIYRRSGDAVRDSA